MLTIDTIPLYINGKLKVEMENSIRYSPFSILHSQLLVFLMQRVTAAAAAELFELEPVRRVLFVLSRHVIALLTISALQNNVVSSAFRHFFTSISRRWSVVGRRLFSDN